MEQQVIKPSQRSNYFTEELRQKLETGTALIRVLRNVGVRVFRTDYSEARPLLEIEPADAHVLMQMSVSIRRRQTGPGGETRHILLIDGCHVAWTEPGAAA